QKQPFVDPLPEKAPVQDLCGLVLRHLPRKVRLDLLPRPFDEFPVRRILLPEALVSVEQLLLVQKQWDQGMVGRQAVRARVYGDDSAMQKVAFFVDSTA